MSCCWRNPTSFFHLNYTLKTSDYKDEKKKNLQLKTQPRAPESIFQFGKCEISTSNSVDFVEELCISYGRSKTHTIPGLVYDSVWPEAEHANSLRYNLILPLKVNGSITTKNTTNMLRVLLKWLGKLVTEHFLKNKMRTRFDYLVPNIFKEMKQTTKLSFQPNQMNFSRNIS